MRYRSKKTGRSVSAHYAKRHPKAVEPFDPDERISMPLQTTLDELGKLLDEYIAKAWRVWPSDPTVRYRVIGVLVVEERRTEFSGLEDKNQRWVETGQRAFRADGEWSLRDYLQRGAP